MSDIQKQAQVGAPVVLPSRRKLIRLGAAAVPVVATLTSQSALAGNCISTSAWGSDQMSKSASQKARHDARGVAVTQGYTITAWNATRTGNNDNSEPWRLLQEAYPNKIKKNFNQNDITFKDLAGLDRAKIRIPAGFTLTDVVVGKLTSSDASFFLVAQLNFAVGQKPPTQCITDTDWGLIVAGMYPTTGSPWTLTQTALYLRSNFIVQP